MTTHFSVHSIDPSPVLGTVQFGHKLRLSPPADPFSLCHYTLPPAAVKVPIRGFYQMKALSAGELWT